MKYLGILAALAIIYLVAAQLGSSNSGLKASISEATSEADKVNPAVAPAKPMATITTTGATPPPPPSIRAPIDRARALNGIVKQRNGAGEF